MNAKKYVTTIEPTQQRCISRDMDAFVSIELVITVYCHGESLCPVWSLKLEIVVAQKKKIF